MIDGRKSHYLSAAHINKECGHWGQQSELRAMRISEALAGRNLSEAHKHKISQNSGTRRHMLSDEHKNKECGCWGKTYSLDVRQKRSISQQSHFASGEHKNKECSHWDNTLSVERRQKRSEALKAHFESEQHHNKECGHSAGTAFGPNREPTSIELILYALLESAGIQYEREKRCGRYDVDAYDAEHRIAFEAYGEYWHTRPERIIIDCERVPYLEARDDIDAVVIFWEDELRELQKMFPW